MVAGRDKKPTPVRCMKTRRDGTRCYWRGTLSKQPLEYVRPPVCPRCKKPITIIDWWRIRKEWKVKPCNCGGYAFPHHRGRGYCTHNPKLTAEDLRLREEGGPRRDPDEDAVPF
jgi:hypothetical protein